MPVGVPDFGQLVEYITEGPVIHRVDLAQHSLDVLPTLDAVAADYAKVAVLGRSADLSAGEVGALKTALAPAYHSDMVALATLTLAPGEIVTALADVKRRPDWRAGLAVAVGQVVGYEKNLYECVQAHTTQGDWMPPVAKALWKRFYEPADDPWPWVQPTGAHDAYPVGARVTFGGFTWQNTIPANVWQPGVTGWTNLDAPATLEWTTGVAYKLNDEVTYGGARYRCRQAHTSIATWTPPATPALWLLL